MPANRVPSRSGVGRRAVAFFLLLLFLAQVSGCTSWKVALGPPAQVIQEEQPSRIRVILQHRDTLVFAEPAIEADSLAGTVEGTGYTKVAVSDVTLLELQKTSALKTFGLVYVIVGVAAGIALILSCPDDATLPPCG